MNCCLSPHYDIIRITKLLVNRNSNALKINSNPNSNRFGARPEQFEMSTNPDILESLYYKHLDLDSNVQIDQFKRNKELSVEEWHDTEYGINKGTYRGRVPWQEAPDSNSHLPIFISRRRNYRRKPYKNVHFGDRIFELITNLQGIINLIDDSEHLLYAKAQDEYLKPSKIALYNSLTFLSNYANELHNKGNYTIKTPNLDVTKSGSIDLDWSSNSNQIGLLINFKEEDSIYCSFYGFTDGMKKPIKGKLDLKKVESYFVQWLIANLAS